MKKIDIAQSFKNLGQWFKNIPQMDKKVLTLNIIKFICYFCTFPALFIATMVGCGKVAEGMSFYTFWPYAAGIFVAIFGLIFAIVALAINRKKAKKRTVMEKTAILLVVVIVLTAGLGLLFDIGLPDLLAQQTFGTLFVEDMYVRGVEESRVVENYIHLFIGLNLLNGNYDGELYYETVKADEATQSAVEAIIEDEDFINYVCELYPDIEDEEGELDAVRLDAAMKAEFDKYWLESGQYTELDKELYDFIYNHYVLLDYDYAFKNTATRKAFCLALVEVYSDTYKQLCKEGFKTNSFGALGCTGNEKLTQIYGQNYASQDMDGYMPINEDTGIGFATNNRMTTPLIIRMFLNDSYTYTTPVYGEDGKTVVDYDGFMVYLYRPEIKEAYEEAGGTYVDGKSAELFAFEGTNYYVYETGHVDAPYRWCLLDLLGEPMPLAEIEIDLEAILGKDMNDVVEELLGGLGGFLDTQSGNIEDLLENGLTNSVIVTASDGQVLHLNVYVTDDGAIAATLYPQGMRDGYIGYQYMAWLEMGNILLAICGVVQMRNLLYIFGAISVVMLIVIAFLDTHIQKRKQILAEQSEAECECDDNCAQDEQADEDSAEGIDEPIVSEEIIAQDESPETV